jgi:hypothetical protein
LSNFIKQKCSCTKVVSNNNLYEKGLNIERNVCVFYKKHRCVCSKLNYENKDKNIMRGERGRERER